MISISPLDGSKRLRFGGSFWDLSATRQPANWICAKRTALIPESLFSLLVMRRIGDVLVRDQGCISAGG